MPADHAGRTSSAFAQLTAALGDSHEPFVAVFESCPVALSVGTADEGRLVGVNERWSDLFGYSRDEAIGRTPEDLNIVDHEVCADVVARLAGGGMRDVEVVIRRRSGETRTTLVSGTVIDLPGARDLWIASVVDITERVRLRAISDAALSFLSLDALLHELLARVREAIGADLAAVRLVDTTQGMLFVRAVDGVPLAAIAPHGIPMASVNLTRPVLNNALEPPEAEDDWKDQLWRSIGLRPQSAVMAPLIVEGTAIGLLTAVASQSQFTESDLRLLQLTADRVAPAIERARLAESLEKSQTRLRRVSRRLLNAEETVRRRIAVQLHDDLGQALTAARLKLESVRDQASSATIADALAALDDTTRRVRELALDLRPAVLDDLGLSAALRWYVDRWRRETGIHVSVSIDTAPPLDAALETACFRLAQEALTNIARHARAAHVWFDLHVLGGALELGIRDDGVGFDPELARARALQGASLGLLGMEERATMAGGEVEIVSTPGRGASVQARFPPLSSPARA